MSQLNRHRHQFGRFVASITEHKALVAGAAGIDSHGDVGGLGLHAAQNAASVCVKTVLCAGVTHIANHLPSELFVFEMTLEFLLNGDLASDYHEAGREKRLATYTAHRVIFQNGIYDCV